MKRVWLHPVVLTWWAVASAANASPAIEESENQFLDMDITQLMEVTITSVAKKPQSLADAAAAVFVITQEDIRRSGVTSIPDALAMAPGIQVAKISSSKWAVSSRGFGGYTSNKLLVLMDGRSVYTPAFSGTFWDMNTTMLEDIERIEVIRGPGATVWGANAVNGVINIITKKAEDTQGGLVRAGIGDQETFMGATRYGAQIGESTYGRFYVTGNDRDSNLLADTKEDAYDGWSNIQGGFRLDGTLAARTEWTVQGDLYKNSGDELTYPYWSDTSPYLSANYGDLDSDGANLIASLQQKLDNGDQLSLKAYYDYNNRDNALWGQTFTTLDFELQYETMLGQRNNLTMGTGYRYIDGDFVETYNVVLSDQSENIYSAFVQDEFTWLEDILWVTTGVKYEHNDFTGSEWQPSVRVMWKPHEEHSLWGAVSRAVRTPSMVENNGAVTIGVIPTDYGLQKINMTGTENFDSEELVAYEMDYRWQVTSRFFVDMALFYNEYEGIYSLDASGDPYDTNVYFKNLYDGSGKGVELAANWQPTNWLSFMFTYSYLDLDLDLGQNLVLTSYEEMQNVFEVNSPEHQLSLRTSIELTSDLQLNLWGRFVDETKSTRLTIYELKTVPSYWLFDANIIWTPVEDLEVMLAGQNLLNSSELEYIPEWITPAIEIERSVYGKITWKF